MTFHVFQSMFIGALIAQHALSATGIPTFHIDLDLPPEERWTAVVVHYSHEIEALSNKLNAVIHATLGDQYEDWLNLFKTDPEYEREIRGIAKIRKQMPTSVLNKTDVSLEYGAKQMILAGNLYELASPTSPTNAKSCAGVLWAASNGTVMHGRNMDYFVEFEMPDGKKKNWADVTFHAVFMKNKQPIIKATMWPGSVGFQTAMRIGGWSFEQNARTNNELHANFDALRSGGQGFSSVVRRLMETTTNFTTAVDTLYATRFIAPQYFIMSGSAPYEGAVVTIDRLGQHLPMPQTPPIQRLQAAPSTAWHLVQTNDDLLRPAQDIRRPIANQKLTEMQQDYVSPQHLLNFMHEPPLKQCSDGFCLTVFSTVMVPATGFYATVLANESSAGAINILESARPRRQVANLAISKRRGRFLGPTTIYDDDVASLMQVAFDR